jgi:hypothetical protein
VLASEAGTERYVRTFPKQIVILKRGLARIAYATGRKPGRPLTSFKED